MRSYLLCLVVLGGFAVSAAEVDRAPAGSYDKTAKKKHKSKKAAAQAKKRTTTGADHEEGWIVHQTDKGTVKVRRNQTFVFEGSDISGAANRPSQTVLGQRPNYESRTLIPERSSFRKEFYESAGYTPGGKSE